MIQEETFVMPFADVFTHAHYTPKLSFEEFFD
jgi:hypothetical protein